MKSNFCTFKVQEKCVYYMVEVFRKGDLTGKRRRSKVKHLLSKELFGRFKEKYPEYKNLEYSTFEKIVSDFNKVLWQKVIDDPFGIELPEGLGELYIASIKKNKRQDIDYKKSRETGVKVLHRNLHSEGYSCSIYYTNAKHKYKFALRKMWRFRPHRLFTRAASKEYRECWEKYRIVTSEFTDYNFEVRSRNIILERQKRAEQLKKEVTEYNEFEI